MKNPTFILAVVCSTILMTSCNKDKDVATPSTSSDQITDFFAKNISDRTQHFIVNPANGEFITGAQGTRILFFDNLVFSSNNQPVSGFVDVELIEIYDRASMVLLNKPTMGRLPNGDLSTLLSGGEYYLKITKNGQDVTAPNGVYVILPGDNTGGVVFGMQLFDGLIVNDNLEWQLASDSVVTLPDSLGNPGTYQILDNSWGWTNVDIFYEDPRPKTVLQVKLPEGFNQTNSEVYLTYDGQPTALASLDTYTETGFFSEHYGLIPIDLNVHFIAVTLINGQLNYAITAATITDGHIEYINGFTPISEADLAVLINALP